LLADGFASDQPLKSPERLAKEMNITMILVQFCGY